MVCRNRFLISGRYPLTYVVVGFFGGLMTTKAIITLIVIMIAFIVIS